MKPRGRFAPSPTGRLHFGSLVAALASWLSARAAGGSWIVRMEDIDRAREVRGAAASILRTLTAFGLESDEPVVYQSACNVDYAAALSRLESAGHAYRCWCSRTDLEPFGGIHPVACVAPPASRAPAWRLRVGDAIVSFEDAIQGAVTQDLRREVGDFVIWRADDCVSYQLAVVVDDAAQGISEVVRGADLTDSTPRQILLQRLLGFASPSYAHVPLALDANGAKLSKHAAACPVDAGDPLPALRAALRFLGQRIPAGRNRAVLLSRAARDFDVHRVPRVTGAAVPLRQRARTSAQIGGTITHDASGVVRTTNHQKEHQS